MAEVLFHSYDPDIAKVYGINAALVYQHIVWRSENGRDRFVQASLEELTKTYTYLGKKQIRNALHLLVMAGRNRPVLVLRNNEGGCYTYAPICDFVRKPLRKFEVAFAERYGIVPAIIYGNIGYWIRKNWSDKSRELSDKLIDSQDRFKDIKQLHTFAYSFTRKAASHHGKIEAWCDLHPYIKLRTAQRGFALLVKEGLLEVRHTSRKTPVWTLPLPERAKFVYNQLKLMGLFSCPEDMDVRTTRSMSQRHDGCQDDTVDVNTARKQGLSARFLEAYKAVEEALVVEASVVEADSEDMISAQRESHLANARCSSPAELRIDLDSPPSLLKTGEVNDLMNQLDPEIRRSIRSLGKANVPRDAKPVQLDDFGDPVKRQYVRKLGPVFDSSLPAEEQEFDLYFTERSGS